MAQRDEPEVKITDARTGEELDRSVLEESDVAFVPERQYLDLSKEEKRRTTALMMAVTAYKELIIKDAEYLRVASDLARRDEGPKIKAATVDAMVDTAIKFDDFIAGRSALSSEDETRGGEQTSSTDDNA